MQVSSKPTSGYQREFAAVSEAEWRLEVKQSVRRFHLIAAWAAIIFDPLVGLADYFNIPESWLPVFYIRIAVAI